MRSFVASLVLIPLLSTAGCALRTNPMVTEIKAVRGTEESPQGITEVSTTTFTYDDDLQPLNVTLTDTQNPDVVVVETWDLTWEDGRLVASTYASTEDGDPRELREAVYDYQGKNLATVTTDLGDRAERVTELTVEAGRITAIRTRTSSPGGVLSQSQTMRYGDDGALTSVTTKITRGEGDEETDVSEQKISLSYKEGRPTRATFTDSNDEERVTRVDVAYDDEGKLKSLTDVLVGGAEDGSDLKQPAGKLAYDDEGRVSRITIENEDAEGEENPEQNDVFITFRYEEDTDAEGLDMTPLRLLRLPFFDLRGTAQHDFDEETQAARLVDVSW
jgi:hypothetical protein